MISQEPQIIGESRAIQKVREVIGKVADVDLNVLISGESGVGKELVACALHSHSRRCKNAFIKVNCAAIPGELMETELFGHEKGAFTGADRAKKGKFEAAEDGSIFLDEIGEVPLPMQAKLLQVLQDQKFSRIGGNQEVGTRARIIAATNRNLEAEILAGTFREDLYFRINTITVIVPPLRERKEDIVPLVEYFLKLQVEQFKLPKVDISDRIMDLFYDHHWPGNVRELENYLKRLSVLGNSKEIEAELHRQIHGNHTNRSDRSKPVDVTQIAIEEAINSNRSARKFPPLKQIRDEAVYRVEKAVIEQVLGETNWNRREAAKILKISYRTLLYKLKEMAIHPGA